MQTYEHYTIWGCGPYAGGLYRTLHVMAREIYLAKHDVKAGTMSHHGYSAFFKSNRYKDFIGALLNVMIYGVPAAVHPPRSLLQGFGPMNVNTAANIPRMPSPQLICATERSSSIFRIPFDVFAYCAQHPSQYAFVVKPSAYVIICPTFWSTRVNPDNALPRCPTVRDNQFEGYDHNLRNGILRDHDVGRRERLTGLRRYNLMHEIVYYYLQQLSLAIDTNPKETDDWNECVALDPEDSWRNPENWVLYVASKSSGLEFPQRSNMMV